MKKILIILLISIICGCEVQTKEPNIENEKEEKIPTMQEILLEQAREIYGDEQSLGTYFTPFRSIEDGLQYAHLFDDCNKSTTGIEYKSFKLDERVITQYKLYFICGDQSKMQIYYYNDISEGAKPINITEKEI